MAITLQCPHCSVQFDYAGTDIGCTCQYCGNQFLVKDTMITSTAAVVVNKSQGGGAVVPLQGTLSKQQVSNLLVCLQTDIYTGDINSVERDFVQLQLFFPSLKSAYTRSIKPTASIAAAINAQVEFRMRLKAACDEVSAPYTLSEDILKKYYHTYTHLDHDYARFRSDVEAYKAGNLGRGSFKETSSALFWVLQSFKSVPNTTDTTLKRCLLEVERLIKQLLVMKYNLCGLLWFILLLIAMQLIFTTSGTLLAAPFPLSFALGLILFIAMLCHHYIVHKRISEQAMLVCKSCETLMGSLTPVMHATSQLLQEVTLQ